MLGSHTYAEEGANVIRVTVHHGAAPDATAASTAIVSDPAVVAAGGLTLSAIEGAAITAQTVATFTDPGGAEALSEYSATIDWGDGATADAGAISYDGASQVFIVQGSHTYAEQGSDAIRVTIHHAAAPAATAASSAIVSDPVVIAAGGLTALATEGAAFTAQTVATFTDPGGAEALANYSADIDWGDGVTADAGTIGYNSESRVFTVQGGHAYAEQGSDAIHVTIHHEAAPDATAISAATVSDPAVIATGGLTVLATEGAAFNAQTVATFTDPGGAEALANYSANIDWGDGATADIGTISFDGASGVFTVQGGHAYAEQGSDVIDVTIHHDAAPDAIAASTATVGDPAVVPVGGLMVAATEGTAFSAQTLATFTDPGGAEALANYSAEIDWGDGETANAGTIIYDSASQAFTVQGSHAYAEEGAYDIRVTVHHATAPDATVGSTAAVSDPAVVAVGGLTVSAIEGAAFTAQTVAAFTDPGGPESLANYSADIDWGDGATADAGSIVYDSASRVFTVQGSHAYAEEGSDAIRVTIHHATAPDATAASTATVSDPAVVTAGGLTLSTTEGAAFTAQTVATFTDPGGAEAPANYSAGIDWGDGATADAGTIIYDSASQVFTVQGSHTYAEEGSDVIRVTVHHEAAPEATASSAATVGDAKLMGAGVTLDATEAAAFNGTVATFTGANPNGAISDFTATIAWGDGEVSAGAIAAAPGGGFAVAGSHVYAEEGTQSIAVTINDAGGAAATVSSAANTADAPLSGASAAIPAGTTVSGTVASFSDPDIADGVGDYLAAIDWGDGQTDAGIVAAGAAAGQFNVTGGHNYADNFPHTIGVMVTHGSDQPLVVQSVEPGQTINLQGAFGVAEDTYVIGSGTVTVAADGGVLANDTASGPLTVAPGTVTGANGGTFVFHVDGSFTYAPPAGFAGYDYAPYTATDAQGDNASATVNVLSQTAGVVWKFYESVLDRDPDYGGLKYWANDFATGGKTGDIAVGFFESDELLNKIIGDYYQQYLGRTLDADGLKYWEGVWHATGGPEGIKAGFAASPEFNKNAGDTADGWLTALYAKILNRTPDAQGFSYWQQQLAAGMSEYNVALGFFDSLEAYKSDVTGWFSEYLDRAPSDAELMQYANEMKSGKSDRDIEQEITNLPEYGANPSAAPAGAAARLPDYLPQTASAVSQQQASIAAKDRVFAGLGD